MVLKAAGSGVNCPAMNTLLETFPNPRTGRNYTIRVRAPEFTCLCPKTGQPDFAELLIDYVPKALCVELKSLKMYLNSFRDRGAFHEAVSNEILDELVSLIEPRHMRLRARFNVRGGLYTTVTVEHSAPGWSPDAAVHENRAGDTA